MTKPVEPVAKKYSITDSVTGVLPIEANMVTVSDLAEFVAEAEKAGASFLTFNTDDDAEVYGLEFCKEAARS